jgi:hypothetical protein
MNEKAFKTSIMSSIKAEFRFPHVVAIATPFMGGIPDLYTKIPGFPACWIELKYVDLTKGKSIKDVVPLELSPQQRIFIGAEQTAGDTLAGRCMYECQRWRCTSLRDGIPPSKKSRCKRSRIKGCGCTLLGAYCHST